MKSLKNRIQKLEKLDYLIRIKGTGTPDQLAKCLGICKQTLYNYLSVMKDLGATIRFDKYKDSYYYGESGGFNFKFSKYQPHNV